MIKIYHKFILHEEGDFENYNIYTGKNYTKITDLHKKHDERQVVSVIYEPGVKKVENRYISNAYSVELAKPLKKLSRTEWSKMHLWAEYAKSGYIRKSDTLIIETNKVLPNYNKRVVQGPNHPVTGEEMFRACTFKEFLENDFLSLFQRYGFAVFKAAVDKDENLFKKSISVNIFKLLSINQLQSFITKLSENPKYMKYVPEKIAAQALALQF